MAKKPTKKGPAEPKPVPDPIAYVTCPECDNDQGDAGRNVRCEVCGFGPMPWYDDKGTLHE